MKRFTIRYLYICLATLFVVFSWEHATTRGTARAQQSESAKIGRVFKGDSNKPKQENPQSVSVEIQNKDNSKGTPDVAADRAVINFTELANEKRPESAKTNNRQVHIHPPNPKHLINSLRRTVQRAGPTPQQTTKPLDTPSPSVSASFQALGDDGTTIPPDTMGAVGPGPSNGHAKQRGGNRRS